MAVNRSIAGDRLPYIDVRVRVGSFDGQVEAPLDTGFDGFLALPEGSLPGSEVPTAIFNGPWPTDLRSRRQRTSGSLRIGSTELAPATVIELGDEAIIGLRVIGAFRVILDRGRQVVFES